ncbi:MAG: MBL fold metallo-hydrolase [Hyphomicrobiaceae bacterium]|nr:MBL fold metallo-hydrolase [Hyphomicrobiaceae bacterium]
MRPRGHGIDARAAGATRSLSVPLSRRGFLAAVAAVVTGATAGLAPTLLMAATRTHKLAVGAAEIMIVSDGVFSLPLSLVLPDTPKERLEVLFKQHGTGLEIVAETNVTIVRDGAMLALIDTGAGPDFMPTLGRLPDTLDALGIKAEDVTHVVFTHAHADHLWGVVDPFGDGSRWPNARHVMTATERDFWLAPNVEDRVPAFQKGMATGIQRRLKALGDIIVGVTSNTQVAPGLALLPAPGHTPGHAAVVVRSGTEEVIVGGDALTHAVVSFAAPDWRWGSDIDWQTAAATRSRMLDRLTTSKARLVGYHLPWPGVGRVERDGTAFKFVGA